MNQQDKDLIALAQTYLPLQRCPGGRITHANYCCLHCGFDFETANECGKANRCHEKAHDARPKNETLERVGTVTISERRLVMERPHVVPFPVPPTPRESPSFPSAVDALRLDIATCRSVAEAYQLWRAIEALTGEMVKLTEAAQRRCEELLEIV